VSGTDYTAPSWGSAALVVIDLQLEFMDGGALPVPGTSQIVGPVADVAAAFRAAGLPIVHVVRFYEPGGSDTDLPRRAAVEAGAKVTAPGSTASQIPAAVLPVPTLLQPEVLLAGQPQQLGPNEVVFFKPRWSAFYRTELESWLRERQVSTVVVAGCNLPNCPRATLFDASERDFRTVLVTDAVSQSTPERLADLQNIGVTLLSVSELVAALQVVG
jgi:nicotinamidase-related amidase